MADDGDLGIGDEGVGGLVLVTACNGPGVCAGKRPSAERERERVLLCMLCECTCECLLLNAPVGGVNAASNQRPGATPEINDCGTGTETC